MLISTGQSPGPSKNDKRIDSPTPATDADKARGHGTNDPRVKVSTSRGHQTYSETCDEGTLEKYPYMTGVLSS